MKYEAKNGKIPINPANSMTFLRIIGSFCLLFIPACSAMFLAIYTLAGVTDVLDGWLARKIGTASAWGARLDSIADLFFYAVLFLKIFPILKLPVGIWCGVIVVLLLRVTRIKHQQQSERIGSRQRKGAMTAYETDSNCIYIQHRLYETICRITGKEN